MNEFTYVDPKTLGRALGEAGRSQAGLARHLGLDTSAVNRMVCGVRQIKAAELVGINEYMAATTGGAAPADSGFSHDVLVTRLQERLTALGLSARAASLGAGLGPDAIRTIQNGSSNAPSVAAVMGLARSLDCTVGYLVGETDDLTPAQYLPKAVAYADPLRLEYITADVPTVSRMIDDRLDILIDMATRRPIGFTLHGSWPAMPAGEEQ